MSTYVRANRPRAAFISGSIKTNSDAEEGEDVRQVLFQPDTVSCYNSPVLAGLLKQTCDRSLLGITSFSL